MDLYHDKTAAEYKQERSRENPMRASRQPLMPAHANCCHSQTQSRPSSASPASPAHVPPLTQEIAQYTPVDRVCAVHQPLATKDRQGYSHSTHHERMSDLSQ